MRVPDVFDADVTGTICDEEFMHVCMWALGE